ncbi:hypothetical protein BC937DRAFT_86421 [Endogone sp. FLAS-F59071]|nr:hypothetical protein BC937DRAFT_86421 [Endogone sp. FLAS-F59071]|eukprot:RUS13052.1 hypothetical protein BC937DRAFT_86421 [Endogone sp. FLAS-F59071]
MSQEQLSMGDGRWTMGDGRWAMDDGRWAMGDERWAMDDGRWTMDDDDGIILGRRTHHMSFASLVCLSAVCHD